MSDKANCELCGDPMPQGEEMFKLHGYSGPCPKPPLKAPVAAAVAAPTDAGAEGFLRDRIIDGILKRFVDIDGIQRGDLTAIQNAVNLALDTFAPDFKDEAAEVFDIVREAMKDTRDPYAILFELGDAMTKFAGPRRQGIVSIAARKRIDDFTAADSDRWWSENKTRVRSESQTRIAKFALRRLPEIQSALAGEMPLASIKALDPEQVVKWLNRAIILLTAAAVVYPPLGAVVVVLRLILVRYESKHPDVGLSIEALAS